MIGLISINHKTASLSRREQFAFSPEEARYLIDEWRRAGYILGGLVLSTCNRLEVYYDCDEAITREHEERLIRSLYDFKRVRTRGTRGSSSPSITRRRSVTSSVSPRAWSPWCRARRRSSGS